LDVNHGQQLAFFWAPFLLIHLGGQDTMTAFSLEDNNLWLRHLLNLSMQVFLALYAFWKSTGRHNLKVLAPSILVFLAGIIRYGERTWALKCGSRDGLREKIWQFKKVQVKADKASYSGTILYVLSSVSGVRDLFSGRTVSQMKVREIFKFQADHIPLEKLLKLLEVELAVMYDDLYTKAMVHRTRSGVLLQCISQVSMISAFLLFVTANNKQYYSGADVAITYTLFIGGFGLEVCSFVLMAMSPWTWAFFKAHERKRLAHVSWLLFSSTIGWPEKRALWSNSIGQYNFLDSCVIHHHVSRTSSKLPIATIRKMHSAVEKKLFARKLRHSKRVKVNKDIMENVVRWVGRVAREEFTRITTEGQHWVHARPIIKSTLNSVANSFGDNIILLHMYTELHLRKRPNDDEVTAGGSDNETTSSTETIMDTCRNISNYMVYLLVVQPSMLPLTGAAEDTLAKFYDKIGKTSEEGVLESAYQLVEDILEFGDEECLKEQEEPGAWREALMEIRDVWMRLLVYAAGKCPAELHAQQLGRGGELLTFVWLLMAHTGIGDVAHQVDLISTDDAMTKQFCAFHFPNNEARPPV